MDPTGAADLRVSLKGKWAALACHETGSLVMQGRNPSSIFLILILTLTRDGIVDELQDRRRGIREVAKSQWGSCCIQHILEHGLEKHRQIALEPLLTGLLEFATNEQGSKSVVKALKEGGKETLDRVVQRMCEPAKGARHAMIVDLAEPAVRPPYGQLVPARRIYDCIRGHTVMLRAARPAPSDRMRAYCVF
ncbi:hypothetical protein B0H13DRAFT_2362997 [Mycena leptocephala]|nr:hypothetical protein B0H13DRAFT_2362997 [Mycena leptocephala]